MISLLLLALAAAPFSSSSPPPVPGTVSGSVTIDGGALTVTDGAGHTTDSLPAVGPALLANGASVDGGVAADTVTASGPVQGSYLVAATSSQGIVMNGSNIFWRDGSIGSAVIRGQAPDGASAVANVLDNNASLVTAGAKLLSGRNNGTEDFYFDKSGALYTGATPKPAAVVVTAANPQAVQTGTSTLSSGTKAITFGTNFSATPVCFCNDTTATAAACNTTSPGTSGFTAKGTSADTFAWICVGDR